MIKSSYNISEFIFIISTDSEILATKIHIIDKGQLAFIINNVWFLTWDWNVSFLPSHQKEFVIWDIKGFEVSWQVVLSKLIIVDKFKFLKVPNSLNIIIDLKCMSIESYQRHRKITIVSNLSQLINKV